MKRWLGGSGLCAVLVWIAGAASAQGPADRIADAVASATAGAAGVRVETIGMTLQGRSVQSVRIAGERPDGGNELRPTLVIIAGLDGRHTGGCDAALGVMRRLIAERPAGLSWADLVVIPCVNPDGLARFESARPRRDVGGNAAAGQTAREDADRDRRIDEDGPVDMNGDGLITQMRVPRPLPAWLRGASAGLVAEPEEPRLLRPADAAKGEVGRWAVLVEGRDQDGDGLIAEDGADGVDLSANFPYRWPEFDGRTGAWPLSEPETRAVADWLQAHPEVVGVLEYAPSDNLLEVPAGGKFDQTGEVPQSGTVLDDDRAWFEAVSTRYKQATGMEKGWADAPGDGSLQGWVYAHLGVAAWVTPGWWGWSVPENAPDAKEGEGDEAENKDEKKSKRKGPDTADAKWLRLSDERVGAAGGGEPGFVAWTPFEHPQLGPVEIGGFVPGFRMNPPEADLDRVAEKQAAFVGELLAMLPRMGEAAVTVERIGDRLWRVRATVGNTGALPTRMAMGVKARRLAPLRWRIEVPAAGLVSGAREQGAASVAPGDELAAEWVVTGEAGDEVVVKLLSPEMGEREVRAVMAER